MTKSYYRYLQVEHEATYLKHYIVCQNLRQINICGHSVMIGSHNKRLMCSVQCLLPRCPPPKLMLISITIITTCADKSNIKVTQTLLFGKMVSQEEHNGGPLIEIIFTFIFSFDSKPSIFYCSCCGHNILHLKQISSIQSVKINNHLQHSFV